MKSDAIIPWLISNPVTAKLLSAKWKHSHQKINWHQLKNPPNDISKGVRLGVICQLNSTGPGRLQVAQSQGGNRVGGITLDDGCGGQTQSSGYLRKDFDGARRHDNIDVVHPAEDAAGQDALHQLGGPRLMQEEVSETKN